MNKILSDIKIVFPIMGYFLLEALIVGVFITLIWKLVLAQKFGELGYPHIVGLYWIAKMVLFDVFKLIGNAQIQIENQDDDDYNESITE